MCDKQKPFADMFLAGQTDCLLGMPVRHPDQDAYMRGYSTQYQHEQNMDKILQKGDTHD